MTTGDRRFYGVLCPECGSTESSVLDMRRANGFNRRRRECAPCGARFTTHETTHEEQDRLSALMRSALVERLDEVLS